MKVLTLEPRSPAWHEARNDSWTASMAAVLVAKPNAILLRDYAAKKGVTLDIAPLLAVGIDEFFEHTLWSLWASKTGRIPRFRGNADTARGTDNEEFVIKEFEKSKMLVCQREVTATSSSHDWMLASFDAVVPADSDPSVSAPYGFPLEAKCPAFPSRKKLWMAKKDHGLAVMGLPYYWCQVQHQIYVAEAPYGWFSAVGAELDKSTGELVPTFPIMEKIPRDDAFLKAYIAAAEFYYNEFIFNMDEPPRLEVDDLVLKALAEDAAVDAALALGQFDEVARTLASVRDAEERLVTRRKSIEAKLVDAARARRVGTDSLVELGDGLLAKFGQSVTVSWQKLAKLYAKKAGLPDIDPVDVKSVTSKPKETVKISEI